MAISLAYVHIKPYCRRSITYLTKVCVKSGYIYHTAHALFFTRPVDMETVSHPVTADQNGRALQTSPFRTATYLCTGNHPRCWSTPIFTRDSSSSKEKKWCKAVSTTSVSLLTEILWSRHQKRYFCFFMEATICFFMVAWLHSW